MSFRDTLLAAQRNQQQKSSESTYYKARFDPPKKEQKQRDKLSANIQKFLAKKDEEEKQKKLEAQRKREEFSAMRDPKALRKIQKTLKVIKSANKSVIQDAVDHDNTAVTREGVEIADQDDYGYESQEAAALYEKMMLKYSKLPDEPKFPIGNSKTRKDLNGTRERVKQALLHEDDPVPHKRRRRTENGEKEKSPLPLYEPEKKDNKPEKPKIRKLAPPPIDFNQLLKLAEQKKSEPVKVSSKLSSEPEPEKLMTKRQRREYEEEMMRRQRRQERMEAEAKGSKRVVKEEKPVERERPAGFGRIPKLGEKNAANRNDSPKTYEKHRGRHEKERVEKDRNERSEPDREREKIQRDKERVSLVREKIEKEKIRVDREKLEKLKAERARIDREMERLSKDKEKLDKTTSKMENKSADRSKFAEKTVDRSRLNSKEPVRQEMKKSIDLKSQNTYRIDKNPNDKKAITNKNDDKYMNGHSSQGKTGTKPSLPQRDMKDRMMLANKKPLSNSSPQLNGQVPKLTGQKLENGKRMPDSKGMTPKRSEDRRPTQAGTSKPGLGNSFDFDKHVKTLGKNGGRPMPADQVKKKPHPDDRRKPKRRLESDSEYDSEMDDFIDDGDENLDYSSHIKEIFGYDKSRYRDMDDDDDPNMETNFVQQQREEYISKKHGIMEDLEDMRMEAMEKKKSKKKRRISDD